MFTVGDMGNGKEYFRGDISHVRLTRILAEGVDPAVLLMIDLEQVEEERKEDVAATRQRIAATLSGLAITPAIDMPGHPVDWLVTPSGIESHLQVAVAEDGRSATLALGNGLVNRQFHLGENLVCYGFDRGGQEFLRSVKPEATIVVDGRQFTVGGLHLPSMATGEKHQSRSPYVSNFFLESWLGDLVADPDAFVVESISTSKPAADLHWQSGEGAAGAAWPPPGLVLNFEYRAPVSVPGFEDLKVTVHYQIYDGIPVIGKWLSFAWSGDRAIELERTLIEDLAFSDEQAGRVFVESEFSFFRGTPVRWFVDPEFKTDSGPVFTERMSDYRLRYWSQAELDQAPSGFGADPEWQGEYRSRGLLQVQYPTGPAKVLNGGTEWKTFRAWTLLQDSSDEERKGLARRQLYRVLFPWSSENRIYMHVLSHDSEAIRKAADQCAECGFDMLILTFGSGLNMMSRDPAYRARISDDFAYARSKGIEVGAYIHFCSGRSYGDGEHDAIHSGGRSLCLGSAFTEAYYAQLFDFMETTGMSCLEVDGPYHGYACASTEHPLHRGEADSWRVNWEQQVAFFRQCMEKDIYIIAPDWYFASGNRKMPMGYKEANWTLPRAQQALIARQNIYDGTWWRTPGMSYHALPLTSVYGGGADSTMEPLSEHLDAYSSVLGTYFGTGIMACYRGFRLYDTDETRRVVQGWVEFYRQHQAILDSDIIHVRRPDGRDLDCMMHVNPLLSERGLAFVWNPTEEAITREFTLPLYYTGLTDSASISLYRSPVDRLSTRILELDREGRAKVPVTVPPLGYVWILVEESH